MREKEISALRLGFQAESVQIPSKKRDKKSGGNMNNIVTDNNPVPPAGTVPGAGAVPPAVPGTVPGTGAVVRYTRKTVGLAFIAGLAAAAVIGGVAILIRRGGGGAAAADVVADGVV